MVGGSECDGIVDKKKDKIEEKEAHRVDNHERSVNKEIRVFICNNILYTNSTYIVYKIICVYITLGTFFVICPVFSNGIRLIVLYSSGLFDIYIKSYFFVRKSISTNHINSV